LHEAWHSFFVELARKLASSLDDKAKLKLKLSSIVYIASRDPKLRQLLSIACSYSNKRPGGCDCLKEPHQYIKNMLYWLSRKGYEPERTILRHMFTDTPLTKGDLLAWARRDEGVIVEALQRLLESRQAEALEFSPQELEVAVKDILAERGDLDGMVYWSHEKIGFALKRLGLQGKRIAQGMRYTITRSTLEELKSRLNTLP